MLLDVFNLPFKPAQYEYIVELHRHVENGLGSNLRARLSTVLAMNIEKGQREMTGKKLYAFNVRYFILLVG